MAIWREPIFDRTLADVTFAIKQIEAWKNSHSHIGDIELLEEEIKLSVNGDVKLEEDLVKLQAGNSYIENETLVLQLGTIYDLKGCLNLSDIIRIEDNISYLADHLARYLYPLEVNTRTWTNSSLPNIDDMKRIARNIHSIFENFYDPREAGEDGEKEEVPDKMLSFEDVNKIEGYLNLLKQMLDSMKASFISSGTRHCGARGLPLRRSI